MTAITEQSDGLHALLAEWREDAARCERDPDTIREAIALSDCADELEACIAHARPEAVDGDKPVAWWNGISNSVFNDRDGGVPSIRWGADAENTWHDIPLYAGYNPVRAEQVALLEDAARLAADQQKGGGEVVAEVYDLIETVPLSAPLSEEWAAKGQSAVRMLRPLPIGTRLCIATETSSNPVGEINARAGVKWYSRDVPRTGTKLYTTPQPSSTAPAQQDGKASGGEVDLEQFRHPVQAWTAMLALEIRRADGALSLPSGRAAALNHACSLMRKAERLLALIDAQKAAHPPHADHKEPQG